MTSYQHLSIPIRVLDSWPRSTGPSLRTSSNKSYRALIELLECTACLSWPAGNNVEALKERLRNANSEIDTKVARQGMEMEKEWKNIRRER